tara:strand:+ start:792 stop:1562 length:771 start_codon:yes stop_codon:yes gene_type:complete
MEDTAIAPSPTSSVTEPVASVASGAPVAAGEPVVEPGTPGETFEIGGKKLSWADALKVATPEQAELMKGIQASYTRKNQALAEERKAFVRDRETRIKELEAKVKPAGELPEYDPYNQESIDARIAKHLNDQTLTELETLRAEQAVAQLEQSFTAFTTEHPDALSDPAINGGIQKLLRADPNISFEDAYYRVAFNEMKAKQEADRKRDAERKAANRQAATTGNAPARTATPTYTRPSPAELKRMSVSDILALSKSIG